MSAPSREVVELEIASVVAGGDGLARPADGQIVFVPGALPGERVLVTITETKKGFRRAALAEIIEAAPARAHPPCPHVADGCGGCDWQHVDPGAQRELKASVVADALRHIAKLDPPPIGLGPDLPAVAYRTTVRAAVHDGRAGFRHRGSHEVVVVDRCLVAHPLVDELIEHGRFGAASEVTIRAGAATGERLVVLESTVDARKDPGVVLPDDVFIVGRKGRGAIHEQVAGRTWRISARSFFQSRPDGAAALVDAVRAAAGTTLAEAGPDATLVDLYSGVGLFAGALGEGGALVMAVEGNASAAGDARHNLVDLADVAVVEGDVQRWTPVEADLVVADPSRDGLGRAAVERIAATGADRLVLVSCDPAAFARDTKLLQAHGFGLATVMLVDLFPHTSHIETVSRFDRHPGDDTAT